MANPGVKARIGLDDKFSGPAKAIKEAVGKDIVGPLKDIGQAGRDISSTISLVKKLGIAAEGAKAVELAGSLLDNTSELKKFSDQIKLSVEELQELEYAAKDSNIGSDTFRGGIREFVQRMGELKAGEGTLKGFLDNVSPKLRDQLKAAKGTSEQFEIMLAAINQLKDPDKAAALTDAAFGGEGELFIRLARQGVRGLRDLRAEARENGLVSSEAAEKAEEMADNIEKVKGAAEGLAMELGSGLLPLIAPVVQKSLEWIRANRSFIRQGIDVVLTKIGEAADSIDFDKVIKVVSDLVTIFRPVVLEIVTLFRDNFDTIKEIAQVATAIFAGVFLAKIAIVLAAVRNFLVNFKDLWGGIKGVLLGFVEFVRGVFTLDMVRAIGGIEKTWAGVGQFFKGLWNAVIGFFRDAFGLIDGLIVKFLPTPIVKAWEGLKDFFRDLWVGVAAIFEWAWNNVVKPVVDAAKTVAGFLADPMGGAPEVPEIVASSPEEAAKLARGLSSTEGHQRAMARGAPVIPVATPLDSASLRGAETKSKIEVEIKSDNPDAVTVKSQSAGPAEVTTRTGRRAVGVGAL